MVAFSVRRLLTLADPRVLRRRAAKLSLHLFLGFALGGPLLGGLTLGAGAASAETRVALVIGNSAYSRLGELPNPTNDADLIASKLVELGFNTTLLKDADQSVMKRAIANFGRRLRLAGRDGVGLFFYAGHGVQSEGNNFLIPVDADIWAEAELVLTAVEANWVLRQMESAGNKTSIVILDACRDNPFAESGRSTSKGLARMNAPTGSFIAYATAPGKTAADGTGTNSPFSSALAAELTKPGLPIEQLFKEVRIKVIQETSGRQTPWDSSSLVEDFYFKASEKKGPEAAETSLWQSVSRAEDPAKLALFLQIYPNSVHAPEARTKLAGLVAAGPQEKTAEPASEQVAAAPADADAERSRAMPKQEEGSPTPPPTPAAKPRQPALSEEEMIGKAQASGELADYEAYLEAYPSGIFADLAKAEIDALGGTDAPPPAPAAAPPASEEEMIGKAQASAEVADYEAYLEAYPSGIFVDLAKAEIDAIKAKATKDQTVAAVTPAPAQPAPAAPQVAKLTPGDITFETPLTRGPDYVRGKTIEELAKGSPHFPPIEGLPESYWKGQQCSNCHSWTRQALCDQGQFYVDKGEDRLTRKQHPYGEDFLKRELMQWAAGGCR